MFADVLARFVNFCDLDCVLLQSLISSKKDVQQLSPVRLAYDEAQRQADRPASRTTKKEQFQTKIVRPQNPLLASAGQLYVFPSTGVLVNMIGRLRKCVLFLTTRTPFL